MAILIGKRSNEGKNGKIYTKLCFTDEWDEASGNAEGLDCTNLTTTMDCKKMQIGSEYIIKYRVGFQGQAVFDGVIEI